LEQDGLGLEALPWWRLGFDNKALVETVFGAVVGLIALFSSYDHVNLPHQRLQIPQQWGIWHIVISLPLVFIDAELAARSRQRDAAEKARERNRAAEERQRVARLDRIRNRLDRGRLAFQLDPSARHRQALQRLLTLLRSPAMAQLFR
jgi:hypothetical protein